LKRGAKGVPVRRLQGLLIANGFSVGRAGIDGDYGPGTDGGFRDFQARHPHTGTNGKPDGICGAKSWAALLGL
jgi:peptidoglycan hydrolase-like protein with peptidoglycan-binding domain